MIHECKLRDIYADDIMRGKKTFEVRRDDREPRYEVGDLLALNLIRSTGDKVEFTGDTILTRVAYVFRDPEWVKDGYVILGIETPKWYERSKT